MLDNSDLVRAFVPKIDDGDTFIYTEMLDRGQRKGNNGRRLVKTFYHRSVDEFNAQMPGIRAMCDLSKVRACTRLATRSWKKVGREFTRLVVETALTENWMGMKTLYNRALGIASPVRKLWLFDVDLIDASTWALEKSLSDAGLLVATIPSKKGVHFITKPHDRRGVQKDGYMVGYEHVQVHKDNPTNLYIPDGAD